jgi:post-segregation antitoxin (ccd killing protein)
MIENRDSTWKKAPIPRGKHHNKTATKTTVSLYLNRKLVERARNNRLNLSRITEQALSSILDYLETQNQTESSKYLLNRRSFPKESRAGRSVWYDRRVRNAEVGGSNPPRSTTIILGNHCFIMKLATY